MRKHVIVATTLLLIEASLGVGFLGMGCGMILVPVFVLAAVALKEGRLRSIRIAGVYAALFAGTIILILTNIALAQRRAEPVINAVKQFKSDHNRYPSALDELVPAYLPSVPHGGFTYFSRNYHYSCSHERPPFFYFAAMMHGIYAYDFVTNTWRTNE